MALTHLADTSVLTRLGQVAVRAEVEALLAADELGRATISDLEVGFSARNASEWDRLMGALARFGRVEVGDDEVRRALAVQRLLADRGLRGRKVPDLLVAAATEAAGLILLHYDADFDHIASVTGQAVRWVVPAGSLS